VNEYKKYYFTKKYNADLLLKEQCVHVQGSLFNIFLAFCRRKYLADVYNLQAFQLCFPPQMYVCTHTHPSNQLMM